MTFGVVWVSAHPTEFIYEVLFYQHYFLCLCEVSAIHFDYMYTTWVIIDKESPCDILFFYNF